MAVIRPSSQTIRLPNDVALLDGSSSSDDTGLASYNWQLESGPLSYQLQPVDSQTLQLKGTRWWFVFSRDRVRPSWRV